jgi:hypothetical protein
MVIYSSEAITDLTNLLFGLRNWTKLELSNEHTLSYVDDISDICDCLDAKAFHFNTQYPIHKRLGEKVHSYRRNKQTYWYIIYNLDPHGNVYIQRILSNHINAETE